MSTLAERLRHARNSRSMSQRAVAERSGVKQQMISKLERGKAKYTGDLVAIADVLRVNPGWLATGRGPMDAADGHSAEDRLVAILDGLSENQVDLILRLIDELQQAPRRRSR